jgi:hypothetical protein
VQTGQVQMQALSTKIRDLSIDQIKVGTKKFPTSFCTSTTSLAYKCPSSENKVIGSVHILFHGIVTQYAAASSPRCLSSHKDIRF